MPRSNYRKLGLRIVGATALLMLTSFPLRAQADRAVGIVVEYSPTSGRIPLVRNGDTSAVAIGTLVESGDRIHLQPASRVVIARRAGNPVVFDTPGPHTVSDASLLGRVGGFLRRTSGLFDGGYRIARTAASRGTESCPAADTTLSIPILGSRSAIRIDQSQLSVAWLGGCAPFEISLDAGGASIASQSNLERRATIFRGLTLSGPMVTLRVRDVRGRSAIHQIELVPAAPSVPPELLADSSLLAAIGIATWYADLEDGRWRLEAFEVLRPHIRAGDPLAGAIGDALLWGGASSEQSMPR